MVKCFRYTDVLYIIKLQKRGNKMEDNVGGVYIFNNTIETSDNIDTHEMDNNRKVYEVIRIIDGVPLYLEDHYARLKNSLGLLGFDLNITESDMSVRIRKVVAANNLTNCNVKVIVYNNERLLQNCLVYISKSYYPSGEEIEKGVRVGLLKLERRDPNIKLVNKEYKERVARSISENNAFEVLLVNSAGVITEGSKSNVFFVKEQKVYTAPGELVLKGITRKYIINACRRIGAEVVEDLINIDSLSCIDGLFLSGTSIKVLPVSYIENREFKSASHSLITAVRDEFDYMIGEYIENHK
jgi:branched-chain amino acid aminotransferase